MTINKLLAFDALTCALTLLALAEVTAARA